MPDENQVAGRRDRGPIRSCDLFLREVTVWTAYLAHIHKVVPVRQAGSGMVAAGSVDLLGLVTGKSVDKVRGLAYINTIRRGAGRSYFLARPVG